MTVGFDYNLFTVPSVIISIIFSGGNGDILRQNNSAARALHLIKRFGKLVKGGNFRAVLLFLCVRDKGREKSNQKRQQTDYNKSVML